MYNHFVQLKSMLLDFIDQRDNMVLAVACPPAEAALMLKLLLDHENGSKDDLFYLFPDAFEAADAFVEKICVRLDRDQRATLKSPGLEPLPSLPQECWPQASIPAVRRMRACLAYARQLVPTATGHRIVWCVSPELISDVSVYLRFFHEVLSVTGIEPWMRGLRLIVRLPQDCSPEHPLFSVPRVDYQRFVIPDHAAEEELRANALDLMLPLAQRMQSQLQLAFIDLAHGRTAVAQPALLSTLNYHQQTNDFGLQALTMIGLGDLARRTGKIDEAKYWYQCAIRPAGEAKQTMSLALIAEHLGEISFERHEYEDARFYYDQLSIVKRAMPDESGLVSALLWRGRAELKLQQPEQATSSFQEAILLCKAFELEHREAECLSELRRAFVARGNPSQGELLANEWQAAPLISEL